MDYGKALSVIRAAKGLSQKDLAELLGKAPSYISRVENGERSMSPKAIDHLCNTLEIPISLFMLLGKKHADIAKLDQRLVEDLSKELLNIVVRDV